MYGWLKRACGCAYRRAARFASRRALVCAALAAGAGCVLAQYARVSGAVWLALGALLLGIWGVFCLRAHGRRAFCVLLAAILCGFAGYARLRGRLPQNLEPGKYEVEGTVAAVPSVQAVKVRAVLTLSDVTLNGAPLDGRLRLYVYGTDALNRFAYGQRIRASGVNVKVPDGQNNPGGFDFRAYLWRGGVSMTGSSTPVKTAVLSEGRGIVSAIYRLRARLAARVDALFGDQADVMRALLLGDRALVTEETYDDFRTTGIAHLIALSGLHVGCIALMLDALLRLLCLPRRAVSAITLVLLTGYAVMAGMSASIVRAVLMYAFAAAARETGYPGDLLTRLAAAFVVQLSFNPLLVRDTGFALSYTAVFGLACLTDAMRALFGARDGEGRIRKWAADAISASAAIQLASVPLVSSAFFSLPLLSIPVNLLAVPFGLLSVYLGAGAVAVSGLSLPLARILAAPARVCWAWIRLLAAKTAALPFSSVTARAWPLWAGIAFFALVGVASPYLTGNRKARRWALSLLALLAAAVLLWPTARNDGLTVTFLDVGYGDAAVIDARGTAYAVDCGRDNGVLADYLTASRADLRAVFVSHPDTDHSGGLASVLKRYRGAKVYVPECWERMEVGAAAEAALAGRQVVSLCAGDRVELAKDIVVEVLWPPEDFVPAEDNEGSLVLRLCYGEANALLTGDIPNTVDRLAAEEAEVLKVAHHGSRYATTAELLSIVRPRLAVISVDGNLFGHPTQEVLDRLAAVGAEVLRTDLHGAVTVTLEPDGRVAYETMRVPEG